MSWLTFSVPLGEANILGLGPQTNAENLTVTLSSDLAWSFGQDAIGAIQHEISEGAFGRIASLESNPNFRDEFVRGRDCLPHFL